MGKLNKCFWMITLLGSNLCLASPFKSLIDRFNAMVFRAECEDLRKAQWHKAINNDNSLSSSITLEENKLSWTENRLDSQTKVVVSTKRDDLDFLTGSYRRTLNYSGKISYETTACFNSVNHAEFCYKSLKKNSSGAMLRLMSHLKADPWISYSASECGSMLVGEFRRHLAEAFLSVDRLKEIRDKDNVRFILIEALIEQGAIDPNWIGDNRIDLELHAVIPDVTHPKEAWGKGLRLFSFDIPPNPMDSRETRLSERLFLRRSFTPKDLYGYIINPSKIEGVELGTSDTYNFITSQNGELTTCLTRLNSRVSPYCVLVLKGTSDEQGKKISLKIQVSKEYRD